MTVRWAEDEPPHLSRKRKADDDQEDLRQVCGWGIPAHFLGASGSYWALSGCLCWAGLMRTRGRLVPVV